MRLLFQTLALLLIPFFAQAQDTTIVQTFTHADDFRAGTFQFPDDPNANYRKILMLYNLRCHDGLVSTPGNYIGCAEWDYSCNTVITDPTQTDSLRRDHPTHTISNFGEEIFEYTDQPTYTFYQNNQYETVYTNTLSETLGTVGQGMDIAPIAAAEDAAKIQFLYTADELTSAGFGAGAFSGLQLDLQEAGALNNAFKIKMKATTANALSVITPELAGWTTVYHKDWDLASAGVSSSNFYNNFDWDGTSNVLIEFSYNKDEASTAINTANGEATTDKGMIAHGDDYSLEMAQAGYIEVPTTVFDNVQNEITISAWTFGNADVLPVNTFLFEGVNADNQRQLNVHLPWSNGQIYWDCGGLGSGYDRVNTTAPVEAIEGQWNHWAFVKNAAIGEMKVYLNGEVFLEGINKFSPIGEIERFYIAANGNGQSGYYGNIDEFAIYNKALDGNTIKDWLYRAPNASHPDYANLVAYYDLNEGQGTSIADSSPTGADATLIGNATWRNTNGENQMMNFEMLESRPNLTFVQGEYEQTTTEIEVIDSLINPANLVTEYGLDGTDLIVLSTNFQYQSGDQILVNQDGTTSVIGTYPTTGMINIGNLEYYDKWPMRVELLSFVTPYGGNIDLGPNGQTWVFDVTDYAPILRGERFMNIERGGQWQEEMDIKFMFITGTPTREIIKTQQIWPLRNGNQYYYGIENINNDVIMEPRDMALHPDGDYFKVRAATTGHEQNGEFVSTTHFIKADVFTEEFTLWKECADNPVYPQGGTWIYDRAGWCPGMATTVNEIDITQYIDFAGTDNITLDYGVSSPAMNSANYLINAQMVTYGPAAFQNDVEIVAIPRPSGLIEYGRINPACNQPIVTIKNTGANDVSSIKIGYQVSGSDISRSYTWTGVLRANDTKDIELPVNTIAFWYTNDDEPVFEATILNVNGGADENAENNYYTSSFSLPKMLEDGGAFELEIRTNTVNADNSYTIKDRGGNIVMSRSQMTSNTTYKDEINLNGTIIRTRIWRSNPF